jgi:hypothetical protein
MDFNRPALSHGIHLLVRLAFEVDLATVAGEKPAMAGNNLIFAAAELGASRKSPSHPGFPIRIPMPPCGSAASRKKVDGIRRSRTVNRCPGKACPIIGFAKGPQDRVRDRVEDGIAIGMADRPGGMVLEPHAAYDQRPALADWRPRLKAVGGHNHGPIR